jgi:hypothetical protein
MAPRHQCRSIDPSFAWLALSHISQVSSAPPPWLRGKVGRERLTCGRRALASLTSAPAAEGGGGGGGGVLNASQARAGLGRELGAALCLRCDVSDGVSDRVSHGWGPQRGAQPFGTSSHSCR